MLRICTICLMAGLILLAGCSDDDENITEPEPVRISGDTVFVTPSSISIQEAMDLADTGGVVMVGDGVYRGNGNRDIDFNGKSLKLVSENGPHSTIIDCQADTFSMHTGILITSRENDAIVDGFTIRNGFSGNGGGIYVKSASPTIQNCIFYDNHATASGGAIKCKAASPDIINCTFIGNSSGMIGGTIFLLAGSSPHLQNCIIAFTAMGEAIISGEGTSLPTLTCCNLYSNPDGNWIDQIVDQADSAGNMNADPQFCDREGNDYHLRETSPAAPANNSCGELIGALPIACSD